MNRQALRRRCRRARCMAASCSADRVDERAHGLSASFAGIGASTFVAPVEFFSMRIDAQHAAIEGRDGRSTCIRRNSPTQKTGTGTAGNLPVRWR